jgi:hypothetical protein
MQMRLYASHGQNDSLHRSSGTGLEQVQDAADDCHSQLSSCSQIHGLESSSSDAGEYVPPELQYVGPVECDSLENFIWWSPAEATQPSHAQPDHLLRLRGGGTPQPPAAGQPSNQRAAGSTGHQAVAM